MKVTRISGLILIIAASFCFTGCFEVNGEFRNVRNHLLSGLKGSYEKDQEFALGPVSLYLAKRIINTGDGEDKSKELIENISEIQIGVYKMKAPSARPDIPHFTEICTKLESGGWIKMVRSLDSSEVSSVFLKTDKKQKLTRMFVVSMNRHELVLTDIKGKLNKLFAIALRDKGLSMSQVKN